MKNVLISAFACDPTKGSEPGNGWKWAEGVARRGYTVHLITTSRSKNEIESRRNSLLFKENINVHYVDHSKFWAKAYYKNIVLMYLAYFLWQIKIYKYTKRNIEIKDLALIHHVTWGSLKIGSFMYNLKKPMLFGPVGGGQLTPLKFRKYLANDFYKELMRNRIGRLIFRINPLSINTLKYSQVLVTNEDTFKLIKDYCAKPPKLIFDASIPDWPKELKFFKARDFINLLWVGKMHPFKGLRLIIEALKIMETESLNKIRLVIVGDGPDRNEIEKLVNLYKLNENVVFIGNVSHKEIIYYYKQSDVFVYTSLRDSFPGQILEAQLSGLPVITLNLHGQSLMVSEENGIKCSIINPEMTIKEIKNAILFYKNDFQNIVIHGTNSYYHAIQQTWDKKIDNILTDFYPKQ